MSQVYCQECIFCYTQKSKKGRGSIKNNHTDNITHHFSRKEEFYHALTHGIGFVFSVAAYIVLIVNGVAIQNVLYRFSFNIYGISLIILYAASMLYHGLIDGKAKNVLEICDYAAIYVLIAGTYTPFVLLVVRGVMGWSIFFLYGLLHLLALCLKYFL